MIITNGNHDYKESFRQKTDGIEDILKFLW